MLVVGFVGIPDFVGTTEIFFIYSRGNGGVYTVIYFSRTVSILLQKY